MGITQCVKDVLAIAKRSQDFDRAQQRIEQLFAESKVAHSNRTATQPCARHRPALPQSGARLAGSRSYGAAPGFAACVTGAAASRCYLRGLSPRVQRLNSRGRALHSIDAKLGIFLADVVL